jgi:glycogen(starch) synthase
MIQRASNIFMIGWEYPPHNSGGLGVACEGMTQSLAGLNTQIYFTLPYSLKMPLAHMQVLECSDPAWFADGQTGAPPFSVYTSLLQSQPTLFTAKELTVDSLQVLPTSELENKVDRYAELVTDAGMAHRKSLDLIHAHDWMSFPAALSLSQKIRKPFVAHIHSTEWDRIPNGNGSQYIMQTEYEGMTHATRVVAVSYYTKNILVEKYGIDPAKIDVVHNGIVPLSSFEQSSIAAERFAPKRPVVVFMGRLTMQKGAEYFLALARKVLDTVPSALFIIAGDGDMYHDLLLKTADKRLSASLLFSGFVRDVQRNRLLNRADVFVMPSLSEPFGLVALEAAQRNTPVIVSKNAGVSEVMPSSIQVDFWDIEKMAQEIERLVTKPEVHTTVITNQLRDLRQVTWENAAKRLQEVYKRAFRGR